MDLRTTELGHTFTYVELQMHCRAVWCAVSWPGKRPGFAVVVGMSHEPHFDSHDIFLLDEHESFDLRQLIRQCGVLDLKYGISSPHGVYGTGSSGRWIGDHQNDAASRFIQEMNAGRNDAPTGREQFSLTPTLMLEMENLYSYVLPQIKELLAPERRMLFLKGSKILSYLSEIEEAEIAELQRGDYPAIEALAFAAIELRDERRIKVQEPRHSPWDDNVLTRGFNIRGRGQKTF